MKKDMPLEGLRWSRDSGSALYDTPQNGRSRTGWGGHEKGYGVKVMPECHKKKFDFLWKNKFEKRLVFRKSRIFSF